MMKLKRHIILFAVCCMACQSAVGAIPDSLLVSVRAAKMLQYTKPDYYLEVIDEIERRGNDNPFNCERARMNCYIFACRYPEMIRSGERCLELVEKYAPMPDEATIDILQSLSTTCTPANLYDRSIHYAQRGIDYAEKVGGYNVTIGYLRFKMAEVLNRMGYTTDALSNAVEGYETSRQPSCDYDERHRYTFQTSILSAIVNLYDQTGDHLSALKYAREAGRTIEGIRSNGEGLPALAINQIETNNRITIACQLQLLGQTDEAERLFSTVDLTLAKQSKAVRNALLRYYRAMGDYRKVESLAYDEIAYDRQRGDTLTQGFADNFKRLAEAENALGKYRDAYVHEEHALMLKERERERIIQGNALELSIVYDVQNKEKTIMRQRSELRLYIIIIVSVVAVAVLLAVKWYDTRRRNRQMVGQIQQLKQLQKERTGRLVKMPVADVIASETAAAPTTDKKMEKIYKAVVAAVEKEELFLAPLTQDEICLKIGYNRNLIAQAMQLYRSTTLTRYITELRLIRAAELLADRNLSVEIVAEQSGFGSLLTLVRNFKTSYGMTPTDYRRLL